MNLPPEGYSGTGVGREIETSGQTPIFLYNIEKNHCQKNCGAVKRIALMKLFGVSFPFGRGMEYRASVPNNFQKGGPKHHGYRGEDDCHRQTGAEGFEATPVIPDCSSSSA
jgi:hypothetical protein